jgi:hypothetical protein
MNLSNQNNLRASVSGHDTQNGGFPPVVNVSRKKNIKGQRISLNENFEPWDPRMANMDYNTFNEVYRTPR